MIIELKYPPPSQQLPPIVEEGVHYTVGRICEEVGGGLGVTFTRQVVATIASITSSQLTTYAADLGAFARSVGGGTY